MQARRCRFACVRERAYRVQVALVDPLGLRTPPPAEDGEPSRDAVLPNGRARQIRKGSQQATAAQSPLKINDPRRPKGTDFVPRFHLTAGKRRDDGIHPGIFSKQIREGRPCGEEHASTMSERVHGDAGQRNIAERTEANDHDARRPPSYHR